MQVTARFMYSLLLRVSVKLAVSICCTTLPCHRLCSCSFVNGCFHVFKTGPVPFSNSLLHIKISCLRFCCLSHLQETLHGLVLAYAVHLESVLMKISCLQLSPLTYVEYIWEAFNVGNQSVVFLTWFFLLSHVLSSFALTFTHKQIVQ